MKKETEKAYAEQSQMLFNVQVRKALIEQFAGEIPTEFIQRWIASRGEKDVTLDTVKAEWEEKYLPAIKWEFIEAQIRKIKDIDPTQNEIVDYIKGIMTAHDLRKEDEDETKTYGMYADYHEPVSEAKSHRILALNRGEKEEFLKVSIVFPPINLFPLNYITNYS